MCVYYKQRPLQTIVKFDYVFLLFYYVIKIIYFCGVIIAYSINCYQCSGTNSNEPFECNEYLDTDTALVPIDCEGIHNAQFCIKHVGRFEGIE